MDGDKFKKDLIAKEERTSVKIQETEVKKYNKLWETTGRLYVIDEGATTERDAKVKELAAEKAKKAAEAAGVNEQAKSAAARIAEANARKAEAEAAEAEARAAAARGKAPAAKPPTEREQLVTRAAELNITHAKDATIAQLKAKIEEAENAAGDDLS